MFDCNVNGHTRGQLHLTPTCDTERALFETTTLSGGLIQGRASAPSAKYAVEKVPRRRRNPHFDGDISRPSESARQSKVREQRRWHFQNIIDFPPAPKLNNQGRLDHSKDEGGVRGEASFEECASVTRRRFYGTPLQDLTGERFYARRLDFNGKPGRPKAHQDLPAARKSRIAAYCRGGLELEDTVEFSTSHGDPYVRRRRSPIWSLSYEPVARAF